MATARLAQLIIGSCDFVIQSDYLKE